MNNGIENGFGNAVSSEVAKDVINNINSLGVQPQGNVTNYNKNYVIGYTEEQKKSIKKLGIVFFVIFLIGINIINYVLIVNKNNIASFIIINIIGILFLMLAVMIILSPNEKVEIINDEIYVTNKFKKKTKVGMKSEITSYQEHSSEALVSSSNKKLFKFRKSGLEDNAIFYKWLTENITKK